MPEPGEVCATIVQLNRMGMWPKDRAMQSLAKDAEDALADVESKEVKDRA